MIENTTNQHMLLDDLQTSSAIGVAVVVVVVVVVVCLLLWLNQLSGS